MSINDSNNKTPQQLTKTENIVSGIWSEVLQQSTINPEDNFFELGGDSLMTMMVMFRINDELHIDMPPYTINQSPTLHEFCESIDNHINSIQSNDLYEEEDFDSMEVESGVI
ncbi:MAG: phosphopantetheine-binding protein [Desulfobacteraceae bacterium]|jgi:acyl carrier protein